MNQDVARKLLQVGEAFRIPGSFFSYEEIKVGNVNHTYTAVIEEQRSWYINVGGIKYYA